MNSLEDMLPMRVCSYLVKLWKRLEPSWECRLDNKLWINEYVWTLQWACNNNPAFPYSTLALPITEIWYLLSVFHCRASEREVLLYKAGNCRSSPSLLSSYGNFCSEGNFPTSLWLEWLAVFSMVFRDWALISYLNHPEMIKRLFNFSLAKGQLTKVATFTFRLALFSRITHTLRAIERTKTAIWYSEHKELTCKLYAEVVRWKVFLSYYYVAILPSCID